MVYAHLSMTGICFKRRSVEMSMDNQKDNLAGGYNEISGRREGIDKAWLFT
jgi:hypothetical protein